MSDPTDDKLLELAEAADNVDWLGDYHAALPIHAAFTDAADPATVAAIIRRLVKAEARQQERDRLRADIEALPVLMREMFDYTNPTDLIDRAAVLAIIRAALATEDKP